MTAWRVLLIALSLVWAGAAAAQRFPAFVGRVTDAADIIPAATENELSAKLEALQRATKRQLVVATVPDLQGFEIRDFGYRMGREWGVGLRDVNNGVILLVAPNERKVSIEVGTGLEGIITDALSATIINEQVLPRFKAGDLPDGVVAGVDALAEQLRAAPEEAKARTDEAAGRFDRANRRRVDGGGDGGGIPPSLIFWGLIFIFVVLPLLRGRRRSYRGRRYRGDSTDPTLPIVLWSVANELGRSRGGGFGGWTGGGSSGGGGWTGGWTDSGFSGGGGGSFSGGGASGSW